MAPTQLLSNSLIHESWFQLNSTKVSCDKSRMVRTSLDKNKSEADSKPPEQNNASFQNVHTGI